MAKKKKQKTNAIRMVEQANVPYKELGFDWEEGHLDAVTAAQKLGLPDEYVFKTLVAKGNHTGMIVAVIPGNQTLDLKKLAHASGNKKVEMLPLDQLEATTGYVRGGCSPIGMRKKFPVYIAKEAEQLDELVVSAGKRGQQLCLKPSHLAQLTEAVFVPLIAE